MAAVASIANSRRRLRRIVTLPKHPREDPGTVGNSHINCSMRKGHQRMMVGGVAPSGTARKFSAMHFGRVELLLVCLIAIVGLASSPPPGNQQSVSPKAAGTRADGLAAWQQVYSVLTHPRCINCHTATNYPQQGDDRHRHLFNVVRGPGGKGVPGLNCATCHQSANADSAGVPGAYNWHLAPLSMKWQDLEDKILSSAQVCQSLTDRAKNHNLDGSAILKHHQDEPLVLWAFQPGRRRDGSVRSLPPLTH